MRRIALFFPLMIMSLIGFAQTIDLTFVGCDTTGRYIKLDSVKIFNHTRGWQEVLFYPDTILRIQNTIGIENYEFENQFALSQNVPNPFDGKTQVSLSLPEAAQVELLVFDVSGKKVATRSIRLNAGAHLFQIELSRPQPYFLSARTANHSSTIKMLNSGSGNGNAISYMGSTDRGGFILKSDVARPVSTGDAMEYVGYATLFDTMRESIHLMRELQGTELIPLPFEFSFLSCPYGYVTDYDGNVYSVVSIGSQCWMKENLRTTHYADGGDIDMGTESTATAPLRMCPDNDSSKVETYGYLYNWNAVMNNMPSTNRVPSNVQGVCPEHWHVPSDAEWQILEVFAGLTPEEAAGDNAFRGHIASDFAGDIGWLAYSGYGYPTYPSNLNAPNRNWTGFSAIPAGSGFYEFAYDAYFWTATSDGSGNWCRDFYFSHSGIGRVKYGAERFYSVRCVYGDPVYDLPTITTMVEDTVHPYFASFGGTLLDNGGSIMNDMGVVYSTVPDFSSIVDSISMLNGGSSFIQIVNGLSPATTYYVKAYAVNLAGVSYGEIVSFTTPAIPGNRCPSAPTVTDYDGNIYSTEQIGSQCWMKENLRVKHTPLGNAIGYMYPNQPLTTSTTIIDTTVAVPYGLLYTWSTMMNGGAGSSSVPSGMQGICPDGWHVPSDEEWKKLEIFAGMDSTDVQQAGYRSDIAVSLCDTFGWIPSSVANVPGNPDAPNRNVTGFSAIPAGWGGSMQGSGSAGYFGEMAMFWTSTLYDSGTVWYRAMRNYDSWIVRDIATQASFYFSLRCVKDE